MKPTRRIPGLCILLTAGFVLLPAPTPAQEVPDAYARLAESLLGGDLHPGEIPDGFPSEAIPADAELLGWLERRTETVLALRVPGPQPATQREVTIRLLENGWSYGAMAQHAGFQASEEVQLPDSMAILQRPPHFCRDGETIWVMANPSDAGTVIKLSWHGGQHFGCDTGPTARSVFPILRAPAGMPMRGGGVMSGDSHGSARAYLEGDLSPAAAIGHFVEQLVEGGWSVEEGNDTPDFAYRAARKADLEHGTWLGFLRVTRMPWGLLEVDFEIMGPDATVAAIQRK